MKKRCIGTKHTQLIYGRSQLVWQDFTTETKDVGFSSQNPKSKKLEAKDDDDD
jgi:hypothetical protein